MFSWVAVAVCLLLLTAPGVRAEEERPAGTSVVTAPDWHYGAYLDVGYILDTNQPENGQWRSKSTSNRVGEPKVNMAKAYVEKDATPQSRWGMQFGLQAGVDAEGLVTEGPPAALEPVSNADTLRHLSSTNLSYLMPMGNGFEVTGGLFPGFPAWESFLAIDNPNYTRGYLTDTVPYYLAGLRGAYPLNDALDMSLFVVTGYNYLTSPNDVPSYGLQVEWRASSEITFTQNFYYGPDQENTDLQYWRFLSDSILEWRREPFLIAASFDFGNEKQAFQPGTPQHNWMSGALWAAWEFEEQWSLAFRPEFYYDPDGLITGAEQFIQAYTTTLKYMFSPTADNTMAAVFEYRYDRSTGDGGGYYAGWDNRLVPDQHLFVVALMWSFGR